MDRQEIEAELRRLAAKAREDADYESGSPPDVIGERIDSLEGVELIIAAEERFGISISDTELNRVCRSISRLSELIERKLESRA